MKKIIGLFFLLGFLNLCGQTNSDKLVVITIDGCRWNEVFTGADSILVFNKKFSRPKHKPEQYWKDTPEERRETLMPFFWNYIAEKGQMYGNRTLGNNVNVKNTYWFSYPGYNEMFTGYPDPEINSNNLPPNPNVNVLEFINQQKDYKDRVAVFAGWNAYYSILNAERSKLKISAGWSDVEDEPLTEVQKMLNIQQHVMPKLFGPASRLDAATYYMTREYIDKNKPKVLYLAFIDTDGFGHRGEYDHYLSAINNIDWMIGDLWDYLQSDPFYKDQTTLLITTDHSRGSGDQWISHKNTIPHCDEIWFAAMGPDIPALGEVKTPGQLYQNQIAKTIAAVLGLDFTSPHPIGEVIPTLFEK